MAHHHSNPLPPYQEDAFQDLCTLLAQKRTGLGPNKWIELVEPCATVTGITCVVQGVETCDAELNKVFHTMGGSDVRSEKDDTTREHVYRVDFKLKLPLKPAARSSATGGSFLDEPRVLITGLVLVTLSAVLTTPAAPWMSLAHVLSELFK